jgi:hypothetical protein
LNVGDRTAAALSAHNNPSRDRFGNEVVLSGYNHWMKVNLIQHLTLGSIVTRLTTSPAAGIDYVVQSSLVAADSFPDGSTAVTAAVVFDVNVSNAQPIRLLCYLSYPMSRGITNYTGRWFFVSFLIYNTGQFTMGELEAEFPTSLPIDYPIPSDGEKVLMRLDFWNVGRGAMISSQTFDTFFA